MARREFFGTLRERVTVIQFTRVLACTVSILQVALQKRVQSYATTVLREITGLRYGAEHDVGRLCPVERRLPGSAAPRPERHTGSPRPAHVGLGGRCCRAAHGGVAQGSPSLPHTTTALVAHRACRTGNRRGDGAPQPQPGVGARSGVMRTAPPSWLRSRRRGQPVLLDALTVRSAGEPGRQAPTEVCGVPSRTRRRSCGYRDRRRSASGSR